ncbi:MAG: cytochrome c [Rubrivivax sp.]
MALLRDGVAPHGRVSGPMAEVVLHGTQHLGAADLQAMAVYLQSLPQQAPRTATARTPDAAQRALGATLYDEHCVACHGTQGEGGVTAEGRQVVPALAGNRLVTMDPPTNLVRSIALGGFGPATAGHPRPFGMPPFEQVLDDPRIAALTSFLRSSWGAQASPLSASDVERYRGGG